MPSSKSDKFSNTLYRPFVPPELPLQIGKKLLITRLGEIDPRFHSATYIYPVGYASERTYISYAHVEKECKYYQEIILNNNDLAFKIICEDDKGKLLALLLCL